VTLTDVNLLLYAYDNSSAHHDRARSWLEERLSGSETFALAWSVILAFVRLATNPRVFERPMSVADALDAVDGWLAQPCAVVLDPGPRHVAILRDLLTPVGTAANLTADAHLAALAIEHGASVCSADRDFARFAGLVSENPLSP
jgi:toxin-antitoxin system PIN domain toxin